MIAVIIVNWNGIADTKECVASILEHTEANYNLYIVDNNSDNGEGIALATYYNKLAHIKVVQYHENLGFTGAHNKLWEDHLASATYKHLALVNNDTIVSSAWLSEMLTIAKNSPLVVPLLLDYYNREVIDNVGHIMLTSGEVVPLGNGLPKSIAITNKTSHNNKLIGPCGGGALISTELVADIGFFDSHFSTGYEDAEFGLRALTRGYKSEIAEKSIIYHKGGNSIKKIFSNKYAIQSQRNILYTIFKLYPSTNLILIIPFILIRYLLIMISSLIFLKWQIIKTIVSTIYQFLKADLKKALAARKQLTCKRKIGIVEFFNWQKSAILFDLRRFYNIMILRRPSALDKYR